VLAVIVTIMIITGRSICSTYIFVAITGRFICSVNIYCENNGKVYMQCKQLL
jgi:hypothetical protein